MHGSISNVDDCAGCHQEHRGRDHDLLAEAYNNFDHSIARFNLIKHQINYTASPIECAECHDLDGPLRFLPESCTKCHDAHLPEFMSQHIQDFGLDCLSCHDGKDRMVDFDHQLTAFPLDGQHSPLRCGDCHNQQFKQAEGDFFSGLPGECSGCHQQPEVHAGLFEEGCDECHNSTGWSPALLQGTFFDHAKNTRFSLVKHGLGFDGKPLRCTDCHSLIAAGMGEGVEPDKELFQQQICMDCHLGEAKEEMVSHAEQTGDNCLECHDGVDRMMAFEHAAVFVLDGAHTGLNCQDCHASGYSDTPSSCVSCHQEPEIHEGFFGQECLNCHSTTAWAPALMTNHSFPINHGGEGVVECQTCHSQSYTQYTCYSCHEHQPADILEEHLEEGISQDELPNCVRCHPAGRED